MCLVCVHVPSFTDNSRYGQFISATMDSYNDPCFTTRKHQHTIYTSLSFLEHTASFQRMDHIHTVHHVPLFLLCESPSAERQTACTYTHSHAHRCTQKGKHSPLWIYSLSMFCSSKPIQAHVNASYGGSL